MTATKRETLAAYIESQAEWRRSKADEYPDDDRNERTAEALFDLAAYVRSLPDDERVDELVWEAGIPSLRGDTEEIGRRVSRYGGFDEYPSHDAFLSELVFLAREYPDA